MAQQGLFDAKAPKKKRGGRAGRPKLTPAQRTARKAERAKKRTDARRKGRKVGNKVHVTVERTIDLGKLPPRRTNGKWKKKRA